MAGPARILVFALTALAVHGYEDYLTLTREVEELIQSARNYTFPVNNNEFYQRNGSRSDRCCKYFISISIYSVTQIGSRSEGAHILSRFLKISRSVKKLFKKSGTILKNVCIKPCITIIISECNAKLFCSKPSPLTTFNLYINYEKKFYFYILQYFILHKLKDFVFILPNLIYLQFYSSILK